MKIMVRLFLILFLGGYLAAVSQTTSQGNAIHKDDLVTRSKALEYDLNQIATHYVANDIENLNNSTGGFKITPFTELTLVENSLRIHKLKNSNRLIKINSVKFIDDINFFNHLGQLITTQANVKPKNNSVILDLSLFNKGIYFLKFKKHGAIKRIRIE